MTSLGTSKKLLTLKPWLRAAARTLHPSRAAAKALCKEPLLSHHHNLHCSRRFYSAVPPCASSHPDEKLFEQADSYRMYARVRGPAFPPYRGLQTFVPTLASSLSTAVQILGAGDRVRTCIFRLGRPNVFHKPHALYGAGSPTKERVYPALSGAS